MNIEDLKRKMIWCCACNKKGKTLGSLYTHQKSGLHITTTKYRERDVK